MAIGRGADDAALVRETLGGNGEAFGLLYDRYGDALYNFFRHRVSSASLTEDLVQETFLHVLEALPSYRDEGSFKGWLFQIARNLLTDTYRQGKRHTESVETSLTFQALVEPGATPEETLMAHEQHAEIVALLAQLAPDDRTVLILRWQEEMPFGEIARVMGRSEAAVKVLYFRALRRAEKQLRRMGREVPHA
ncbi:MAG: sigma-70 family RNA polymerase sigma factor [Firmicutes bacterium]|nr:sigma-70 family RNA polymerase sigma factor [Bacillota bacterium]